MCPINKSRGGGGLKVRIHWWGGGNFSLKYGGGGGLVHVTCWGWGIVCTRLHKM